jgi:uncharacterized protein YjdB
MFLFDVSGTGIIAGAAEPGAPAEEIELSADISADEAILLSDALENADTQEPGELPDESAGELPVETQEPSQEISQERTQEAQAALAAAPLSGEAMLTNAVVDEANTTPETAIGLTADESRQFTLPSGSDVRWYTVTVPYDNDCIKLDFTNFTSTAQSMYAAIYSADTVTGGSATSSNYLVRFGSFNTANTYYRKVDTAGVYYIKLYPYSSSYKVPDPVSITVSCVGNDGFEPNDTWQSAIDLEAVSVSKTFTINAPNDIDCFKLQTYNVGESFTVTISDFDYTCDAVSVYVYSESDLSAGKTDYVRCYTGFKQGSSLTYKADTPGWYYIKVLPYSTSSFVPSTKTQTIRYTVTPPDGNELNETWNTATELSAYANKTFTLNANNDVDWFKLTTTVPGQAFNVIVSGFTYEVDYSLSVRVYSGDALRANPNASYLFYQSGIGKTSAGQKTGNMDRAWKADTPGDYYIRIVPNSSSYSGSDSYIPQPLQVRYELIEPDGNEPNEAYHTATLLQDYTDKEFTLNGENDIDWFTFETTIPNEVVRLRFSGFASDYTDYISYIIYKDNAPTSEYVSVSDGSGSSDRNFVKTMSFLDVGKYYVRVKPNKTTERVESILKLRVERDIVAVDAQEPNDTWLTASYMDEDVTMQFNLPSNQDIDWFKFDVDEADRTLQLTATVPQGGTLSYRLYTGTELNAIGADYASYVDYNSTTSGGTHTWYWDLNSADTYYVKADWYNSSGNAELYAIRYNLIAPDEHENNDKWKNAAFVELYTDYEFTLPATNDYDYFRFTVDETNQTLKLNVQIPTGGGLNWALYRLDDFIEIGDNASRMAYDFTSGSGSYTDCYMLDEAGDYILRFSYYSTTTRTPYILRLETIEPDKYDEFVDNNDWTRAYQIDPYVNTQFTLPADNDDDWFKVTANADYQTLKVNLTTPQKGATYCYVYQLTDSGTSSIDSMNVSNSATGVNYTMLGKAGDYYLRFYNYTSYSSEGHTLPRSFWYELIEPDAYEYNNNSDIATRWAQNTPVTLTLPASNDVDWFQIDDVKEGDVITVYAQGLNRSGQRFYLSLYGSNGYTSGYDVSNATISYDSRYLIRTAQMTVKKEDAGQPYKYYIVVDDYPGENYYYSEGNTPVAITLKYTITRPGTPLTNLALAEIDGVIIPSGTKFVMVPIYTPIFASEKGLQWSSSNTAVADIDSDGVITALSVGSATIHAVRPAVSGDHPEPAFQASCVVNVIPPVPATGVVLSVEGHSEYHDSTHSEWFNESTPKDMAQGSNLLLRAQVLPEDATEFKVTWSVSDSDVLNVMSDGRVIAVGSGKASVTATTIDGEFTASMWVVVPDESHPVRGVSISQPSGTLYLGENATLQLSAQVLPTYATNQGISWSSSDETVATVDVTGKVTPLKTGCCDITVKTEEGNKTAACSITVLPPRIRVESVSLNETELQLPLYQTFRLSAIFNPADATDKAVTWTSDNRNVATVNRYGEVTALNIGTVKITVTTADGAKTASCTVMVAAGASVGDVTIDGIIDAADALLILQYDVGLRSLSTEQKAVADVNKDGFINAADAILILRYAVGLINVF